MAQNSEHWSPARDPHALFHHSAVLLWWLQTWYAASQPPPGKTSDDAAVEPIEHMVQVWRHARLKRSGRVVCVLVLGSLLLNSFVVYRVFVFVASYLICLLKVYWILKNSIHIWFKSSDKIISVSLKILVINKKYVSFFLLICNSNICWFIELIFWRLQIDNSWMNPKHFLWCIPAVINAVFVF